MQALSSPDALLQPTESEAGLVGRLVELLAPSLVLRRVALTACALPPDAFPALALLPRCLQAAHLVRVSRLPPSTGHFSLKRFSTQVHQ